MTNSQKNIPVNTLYLFPMLDMLLIDLLKSLSNEEWHLPTIAKLWIVKDVASNKMKKLKLIFFSIILTSFVGCKTEIKSDLQFAYTIDKEGVYIYSLTDNTSKSIYKTDKIFLNDYFKLLNDSTLQVGHQSEIRREEKERKVYSKYFYRADGDSTFITDNPPYTTKDNYEYLTDSIYHINIKTSKVFLASTINYEYYEHSTLKINTRKYNPNGHLISKKDTSFVCGGTSSSSKGIRFCNFTRYYQESEIVLGKTIITERGNLILKEGNVKSILLKFDGHFDPKFGSGYYNPTLTSDAKKTSFQYLAGFLKEGSCIYEMDIDSKRKTKLIGKGFFNPLYSPDNKLLLLFSNNRQSKSNTWINDIYVFDIATKTKMKIGQGENYLWIKRNKNGK
jgi:hypothetical protein